MKVKINVIYDFSVGALTHNMLAPPAIPAPVPTPSIEMICTMMWTLGFLANQNKFSNAGKPVTHRGFWIVLDGHDCGMMIPDVTIPPAPNIAYPLFWPFSSRKPVFAASTVKMNGTPVACAQLLGLPPIPMMTCGDPIGAPTTQTMINVFNGVQVGLTWLDILCGVITIVFSMATDYAFSKIPFDQVFGGRGLGTLMENFLGTALGNSLKGLSAPAILSGFITSSLQGNPTITVSAGLPFLGGQVAVSPMAGEGQPSVVAQGNIPFTRMDTTGSGAAFGTPVTL